MYVEKFFPFLDRGTMIRERMETIGEGDIFCPLEGNEEVSVEEAIKEIGDRTIKVWHIEPLGIKVFNESDRVSVLAKKVIQKMSLECTVTYMDYELVSKDIEIGDDGKAYIQFGRDSFSEIEGVLVDDFINAASNGASIDIEEVKKEIDLSVRYEEEITIEELIEESRVNEDIPAGLDGYMQKMRDEKGDITRKAGEVVTKTDFVYEHLRAYLEAPSEKDSMVPLLLGPTGVFKSATVKNIAEELNMRLMDFRVAFTSRLDYTGLFERYFDPEDGENYSFSCPMEELVVCCDGFLEYCRRALVKIDEVLSSGKLTVVRGSSGNKVEEEVEIDDEQRKDIERLKEYYFEMAKTPILFFDEITRCEDEGVMGVLTTLLNQKKFGDLTFRECKFVAASNASFDDMLDDIYHVDNRVGAAYARRFRPLRITPEDVKERWFEWAESDKMVKVKDEEGRSVKDNEGRAKKESTGESNIHPDLVEYLKKNDAEVYNTSEISRIYDETGDRGTAVLTPSPNYRTWDMLSNYVYVEHKKTKEGEEVALVRETVEGLIGKIHADKLMYFLKNKNYKWSSLQVNTDPDNVEEYKDEIDMFIENSLDSEIPALIVGPSSLGKTARVNEYARNRNAELIVITLSALERIDLLGLPTKVDTDSFIAKELDVKPKMRDVGKMMKGVMKEVREQTDGEGRKVLYLPEKMTTKAPDADIKRKFKDCVDRDVPVVLFFDECNRVTNRAVMSAMFEAISDSRIFGIDFDPRLVKIVGAGNYGENYRTQELDPALVGRFSTYYKPDYDERDVKSFLRYMKRKNDSNKNRNDLFVEFFEDKINRDGVESVVEIMKKVENDSVEEGVPTTRAFDQASRDFNSMANSRMFCGKVLFNSIEKESILSDLKSLIADGDRDSVYRYLVEKTPKILKGSGSWAGVKAGEVVEMANGQVMSAEEMVEALKELNKEILQNHANYSMLSEDEKRSVIDFAMSMITNMNVIDVRNKGLRMDTFQSYFGPEFSQEFAPFFNSRFGERAEKITIAMLDDRDLISDFIEQEYGGFSGSAEEWIEKSSKSMVQFMETHGEGLSDGHYRDMVNGILDNAYSVEARARLFKSSSSGDEIDRMVMRAEMGDNNEIASIVRKSSGLEISEEIIKKIVDKRKSEYGTRRKARLL